MAKRHLTPDEEMGRLLEHRLQQVTVPGGEVCADAETLASYVDDGMSAAERADWEAHFAACAKCRRALALMSRLKETASPEWEGEGGREKGTGGNLWVWMPLAACVLVGAGLWFATRPAERVMAPSSSTAVVQEARGGADSAGAVPQAPPPLAAPGQAAPPPPQPPSDAPSLAAQSKKTAPSTAASSNAAPSAMPPASLDGESGRLPLKDAARREPATREGVLGDKLESNRASASNQPARPPAAEEPAAKPKTATDQFGTSGFRQQQPQQPPAAQSGQVASGPHAQQQAVPARRDADQRAADQRAAKQASTPPPPSPAPQPERPTTGGAASGVSHGTGPAGAAGSSNAPAGSTNTGSAGRAAGASANAVSNANAAGNVNAPSGPTNAANASGGSGAGVNAAASGGARPNAAPVSATAKEAQTSAPAAAPAAASKAAAAADASAPAPPALRGTEAQGRIVAKASADASKADASKAEASKPDEKLQASSGAVAETVVVTGPTTLKAGVNERDAVSPAQRARGLLAVVADPGRPARQWRVFKFGQIEVTRDGGGSWTNELLQLGTAFNATASPAPGVCWVAATKGRVWQLALGARAAAAAPNAVRLAGADEETHASSWQERRVPTEEDLVGVTATSANAAVVTTTTGLRFATSDGGKTWKRQ